MAKKKVDVRSLTPIERHKYFKRNAYEEEKRIELLGQESDLKAAKWVIEDSEEREKEDELFKNEVYFHLERFKRNRISYNRFLTRVFLKFVADEDIPIKYKPWVKATKEGVELGIPNTSFMGAFASCGIPKYDFFACKAMAMKAGNTSAHLEGYRSQSEGGILLPDEIDKKDYARNH